MRSYLIDVTYRGQVPHFTVNVSRAGRFVVVFTQTTLNVAPKMIVDDHIM